MSIRVANYRTKKGPRSLKLVVTATGDHVEAINDTFGDRRIRCSVVGREVKITLDKSSSYHWGKYEEKNDRRVLTINHTSKLELFGSTEIHDLDFDDGSLRFFIPEDVAPPLARKSPTKKRKLPAPSITLRQAVEAVNYHKSELKDELCLSIDSKGELRALIEY